MQTFYMTFGGPLIESWVRFEAPDYDAARRAAFDIFGRKWSMLYPEEGFTREYCKKGELCAIRTDEFLNYKRLA